MIRLKQFLALAGLTAVEVLRQPVSLLLFVTALACMGMSPLFLLHNFGESGKIVRDGALALHMFLGFMLAGYSSCSVMAREIRSGTASAVLSKPVGRELFFLAKYAGVVVVVLFFSLCATGGTLLAEKACEKFYFSSRLVGYYVDNTTGVLLLLCPGAACLIGAFVNVVRKRPFVTAALSSAGVLMLLLVVGACFINEMGRPQSFYCLYDLRLIKASLLICAGLTVVAAIALLLAVRLNTVQAMTALTIIFLLGWVSHYFFGRNADASVAASLLYGLLPDWQHFWMGDRLSDEGVIPTSYAVRAVCYAATYSLAILTAGAALFSNSEMK